MRASTSGAVRIDSSVAPSTTWVDSASSAFARAASASSTKPNSPAGASAIAVRSAAGFALPNARERARIAANLIPVSNAKRTSTSHQWGRSARALSSMPIVTKKSPSSTSRNGLM